MKKRCFVLLLIFALCAALPGCGTQDDAAGTPSPSATPSPSPEVTPSPSPSPSVSPSPTPEVTPSPSPSPSVTPTPTPTVSPSPSPSPSAAPTPAVPGSKVSADMALEGVTNYCRAQYDWSIEKDNPGIMYVEMGEETDTEYKVIFRSYTGSFVYFYVDKESGTTRLTEYVPMLQIEEDAGTIELSDYLEQK